MNKILICIVLLASISYSQSNLVKWDNSYQDSSSFDEDYYFAWKIQGIDNILIVAEGYSDGIDYSFYKISNQDKLDLLFRFNPVLIDTTVASKKLFWGYPWDIGDIVLKWEKKVPTILSSFAHSIERDGVIDIPGWQKKMPAIYFKGKTTQPDIVVTEIKKSKYMSLAQIQSLIK